MVCRCCLEPTPRFVHHGLCCSTVANTQLVGDQNPGNVRLVSLHQNLACQPADHLANCDRAHTTTRGLPGWWLEARQRSVWPADTQSSCRLKGLSGPLAKAWPAESPGQLARRQSSGPKGDGDSYSIFAIFWLRLLQHGHCTKRGELTY